MTREHYLEAREKLKPKEFWADMDAWPLFVGVKNLARAAFISQQLMRVMKVPGDIAEFGCWRGATTSLMAKLISLHKDGKHKKVHAFDTFKGFDKQVQEEKKLRSGYKGSSKELMAQLALVGLADRVVLHVGDICETVKEFDAQLSLVYIDCDVYEPCLAALYGCHAQLSPGGLIVFDEWNDPAWPGETQACNEFLKDHGDEYIQESTPVEQPSLVLVKR